MSIDRETIALDGGIQSKVELLSRLIGMVYDCAVDPSRWEATLSEIRHELGFCNSMLTIWTAPTGNVLLNVTSGIEADYARRLPEHGADIVAQWGGPAKIASFALGDPKVLSWERRPETWMDSRYYREWVEPQGIADLMAVAITRDSDTICSVGFARHRRDGAVGQREVELTRLLVPHLQRAVAISRLLDIKSLAAASFKAALDTVAAGIVLVDGELGVVATNSAAHDMLAARDCIVSRKGQLVLHSDAATAALKVAVRQARAEESRMGRRGIGIPASRVDGSPAVLHVLPLRHGELRAGLMPSADAAIFIAPACGPPPAPSEAVAALFDLTPAETRVFCLIADGKTLSETASMLGISAVTAKTHLLRLFAKTGTHRQAELVRLAGSLAMPA